MGAPELTPEKEPEERRSKQRGDSFEAWARLLEAGGLTFDSTTRRWNLLSGTRGPNKAIRVDQLALIYRRSRILCEQVTYTLNVHRWGKLAQNAAKEIFGPRTRTELHNNFTQGQVDQVWLVLEFTRPNSRETSLGYSNLFDHRKFQTGFLAIKIAMRTGPAGFNLGICEVAAFGYLPADVWNDMNRFIRRSLGLSGVARTARDIKTPDKKYSHELSIGITELIGQNGLMEPAFYTKLQQALEDSTDNRRNGLAGVSSTLDPLGNLVWTASRDVQDPRPQHPITPKIDQELLLPLDGVTLETISQMIRKLSFVWPSFESSSITASVLSEILGDCWASQAPATEGDIDPFQMAKTAWERAGGMRANRLRMLRKIAVAARTHGQFTEEKLALLEIIQLEKRREILAMAMVRIAQICTNESSDSTKLRDVEKMLLEAASIGSTDEQLNYSCFNQMVESGLFSAALDLGKQLLDDQTRLKSVSARADIAITMAQLSVTEMKDDATAIEYLNQARLSDPSSNRARAEIAAIAARTGNIALETEVLAELADVFFANGPRSNQSVSEFELIAAENNLRTLLCALGDATTNGANASDNSEMLLDTTRTLSLLTRPFDDGRAVPPKNALWLDVLEKISYRSDFSILRPVVVKIFFRLSSPDEDCRDNTQAQNTLLKLMFRLINSRDVSEGKQILAAATRSLSHGNKRSWNNDLPTSEAYIELLDKISMDPQNAEWMNEYPEILFSLVALQATIPTITKALKHNVIGKTAWLRKVVDETIANLPLENDRASRATADSDLNDLARLSYAAMEAALDQNNSARAMEILVLAITRSDELSNIFLDSFDTEIDPHRRDFLLRAFAGASVIALGDTTITPILNSKIRSTILTFSPRNRFSQIQNNDSAGRILYESIWQDGQSMPLDEVEIDFLVDQGALKSSPKLLKCFLHQASVNSSAGRASELFKMCLDYVILELGDESLACSIIGTWLARLQPDPVALTKTQDGSRNTIDQLAAELLQLLDEFDRKFADVIREQLGNVGFIRPLDPVPAIVSAWRNGKSEIARNLFRRSLAAVSGSETDMATRLFHALDQLDFNSENIGPDKNEITSLILDWYDDPAISDSMPTQLALLASQHLNDRNRARSVIEKVLARLGNDSPDGQRLWIPHYMLLTETGTREEVHLELDKILPGIRANPGLLSNYPFTIESLEAERGIPAMEPAAAMPEELHLDFPHEISAPLPASPAVEVPPPILFEVQKLESPDTLPQADLEIGPEIEEEIFTEVIPDKDALPELLVEAKLEPEPELELPQMTIAEPVEVSPAPLSVMPPVQQAMDWRAAVRNRKLTSESTLEVFNAEIPNKIEKHVALQAVAVMRGESHTLERWDWRVWRKPHEYGYSRQGKSRFPAGLSPRIMKTPSFRLLLRAAPLLALSFPERFTLKGLAKSLKVPVRQVEAKRQRLNWTTGIAGHSGFGFHSKLFSERGLCLYALQGLGPEIFYDAATSSIYIDDSFFVRKPPTHLYHRIMFLLYSIRTQFYPILNLNPETQILSELSKLKAVMDRGPLAVLAAQAKITDSRMAKLMKPQDFEEFKQLFSRAGELNRDDIKDSSKSMQQYVWRLLLADSLDLTGIIEAMLDVDLLLPGSVKPGEILLMSSQVDPLINFALALKLDEPSATT